MNFLLDTHIWIWYLSENIRLSEKLRTEIANPKNKIWLSPISIWETYLLATKGRIILKPTPEIWIKDGLQELKTKEAPLCNEIALLSHQIELEHNDPADRFIAATAIHLNLILITIDEKLVNADWLKTLN
ncbi:MAG: type II toxin-antitoxin system VapC family toxin [Waterburya sp.]